MSIMFEFLTSLRVDVVSSLIFCVLSSLSCVLSHFLGCPLPAGVGGVRHMGCRLPRLTHHDTSYNVWEDFQTQTNVLPYITGRTESIFHHRCKASLVAIWWWSWLARHNGAFSAGKRNSLKMTSKTKPRKMKSRKINNLIVWIRMRWGNQLMAVQMSWMIEQWIATILKSARKHP